jgi:predicted amidophosphoribosyltransferase
MEVENCPHCGKVFTKIKNQYCPACEAQEEKTFQTVKSYMLANPNCNTSELSEGTHVNAKKILEYSRDGRLDTTKGMHGDIRCLSCNKPISSGRYCPACMIDINQHVSDLFSGNPHNDGTRMHTAHKKTL